MKNIDFNAILKPNLPQISPQQGRILIAEPFMLGFYFSRSIILIVTHDNDETIGLVLNKITDVYSNEFIDGISKFNGALYLGGPTEPHSLHYLHTLGDKVPNAFKITDSIYYGGDFEVLKKLIKKGVADSKSVKFFAGYAGWGAGHLSKELEEHAWVVSTLDDKTIMQMNSIQSWGETLEELGGVYKIWTNIPLEPSFN